MSGFRRLFRTFGSVASALALIGAEAAVAQTAMDPDNPTCPQNPNWSNYREMRFTVQEVDGRPVLLAEGAIDDNLIPRLEAAIQNFQGDEIWLRSPGGNAQVGNQAGMVIRRNNLHTRIPAGWACFSACNFLFMGGTARYVDPGGQFIVHMFTYTGDRESIRSGVEQGVEGTVNLIGRIEQDAAILASEDNAFLIRMGVFRSLLTEVMYQVPAVANEESRETRRCLTPDEAVRYNVANQPIREPAGDK